MKKETINKKLGNELLRNEYERCVKLLKKELYKDGKRNKIDKKKIKHRYNHCLRVGQIALKIGSEMGCFNNEELYMLLFAGTLHDIKKFNKNKSSNHAEDAGEFIKKNLKLKNSFVMMVKYFIINHSEKENYKFNSISSKYTKMKNIIIEADLLDHLDISYVMIKTDDFDIIKLDLLLKEVQSYCYTFGENNLSMEGERIFKKSFPVIDNILKNKIYKLYKYSLADQMIMYASRRKNNYNKTSLKYLSNTFDKLEYKNCEFKGAVLGDLFLLNAPHHLSKLSSCLFDEDLILEEKITGIYGDKSLSRQAEILEDADNTLRKMFDLDEDQNLLSSSGFDGDNISTCKVKCWCCNNENVDKGEKCHNCGEIV